MRGLDGEPGLARAARADEGDEPVAVARARQHPIELVVATDEAGQRGPQVAPPGGAASSAGRGPELVRCRRRPGRPG